MLKSMKNLGWLAVVSLGTAGFMVWKTRQSDKMTMDLLYVLYLALGAGIAALLVGLSVLNWGGFARGTHSVWVVFRKEMFSFFSSWLGYFVLLDYLIIVGYLFYEYMCWPGMTSNMFRDYSHSLLFVSMLTTPMITMRLFAEEKSSGTMEMLVTAPISEVQIVAGKFLAALSFYAATLIPTGIYILMLREYTPGAPAAPDGWYKIHLWVGHLLRHQEQPEMGLIITSYLGVFLMGAIFIAIGTLISSITKHQIVAGMLTLHVIMILWHLFGILTYQKWDVPEDSWRMRVFDALKYMHFENHLEPFKKGLIDSRGIVYSVSSIFFLLFMTVKTLEIRRWK